jgi:putative cardiolipin synthase
VPAIDRSAAEGLANAAALLERSDAAVAFRQAVDGSPFVRDLIARRLPIEWAPVRLVSDDPAKGLGDPGADRLLWSQLKRAMRDPERSLKLISPYFVPGREGTAELIALVRRGVRVQVLTNSLEATDVAAVHAGYAKRRKALLEAGVSLYEIKRLASMPSPARISGGSSGVSGSSLHAKTFSIDDTQLFIGSFNFDPRSARLNTEMGFVIDSPTLARSIAESFGREMPSRAYEVRLAADGELEWVERSGGTEVVHRVEPGTTLMKRIGVALLSWLPIEWLL